MRTGIILVSHGDFAKAALASAEMIMGEQEDIYAFALQTDSSLESLEEEIQMGYESLHKDCERIIAFCDIYGGTPFNALTRCMLRGADFIAYTGLSLPLLIDTLCSRNQDMDEEQFDKHIEEVQTMVLKKIILPSLSDEDEED